MTDAALLEFPCDFPVKIVGRDNEAFREATHEILSRHANPFDPGRLSERRSSKGAYLAFTYLLVAKSQDALDSLYRELSDHDLVLFAL